VKHTHGNSFMNDFDEDAS